MPSNEQKRGHSSAHPRRPKNKTNGSKKDRNQRCGRRGSNSRLLLGLGSLLSADWESSGITTSLLPPGLLALGALGRTDDGQGPTEEASRPNRACGDAATGMRGRGSVGQDGGGGKWTRHRLVPRAGARRAGVSWARVRRGTRWGDLYTKHGDGVISRPRLVGANGWIAETPGQGRGTLMDASIRGKRHQHARLQAASRTHDYPLSPSAT
jgi:hypothetical protein